MADDIYVLGAANLKKRTRTSKKGKTTTRYTVDVKGDSLLLNTDPRTLGKGTAEAIAQLYRDRISSITATASPGTLRAREIAAKAFAAGEPWAVKRYSGGRLGPMAPNQTKHAFNDSGRLIKGIAVGATSDGYKINFPANRWQADQVKGGEAGLQRIWAQLVSLVPELADMRRLMDSIPVRNAINQGMKDAILKAGDREVDLKKRLMQSRIQLAKAALSLVA
jgi:hypothetical protein